MTTTDPQQPTTPDTRSYAALRYPASRMYLGGAALAMMADSIEHVISYWIIFACFVVIESVASVVERLSPLYYPLKFCILLYCHGLSAEARGARVVRERVVAVLSIASGSAYEPAPLAPLSSSDAADGVAKIGKAE